MEQREVKELLLYAIAGLNLEELIALSQQAVMLLRSERDTYSAPYNQEEREYSLEAHGLTERERDVVMLVLEGYSNAEVAARLFVSEATVKKHLRSVYNKMQIKNRVQLIKTILQ